MSHSTTGETGPSDPGPNNRTETTAVKPVTSSLEERALSTDSIKREASLVNSSDSLSFPSSTDAIWQSSGIIPDTMIQEDIFGPDEYDIDESNLFPVEENYLSHLDFETSDEEENMKVILHKADVDEDTDTEEAQAVSVSQTMLLPPNVPMASTEDSDPRESDEDDQPLMTADNDISTEPGAVPLPSVTGDSLSLCQQETSLVPIETLLRMRGEEDSPDAVISNERLAQLVPPAPGDGVKELEEKLEGGLRLLDDLAHANSSDDEELKYIFDAYYNFSQALFKDIKESARAKGGSTSGHPSSDMDLSRLEQQKEEICKQEKLLEKEILHYKATKRELQEVSDKIEEASKLYRKPEILEDVIIPKDIRLSSSSEYVAEIEELQEEILKKQETLKEMQKEIQQCYLPKSLVDSVCESHRREMRSLRDIEEETAYLKECVTRLEIKYLYNTQIA